MKFADEKNKKYPLDEKHIHAAWSYINMPKNAEKYSPEDLKTIKDRIKRAAKKFGVEISEDKKNEEKAAMADKPDEKETPEEEKKESPAEEKKEEENKTEACDTPDMNAEYEAMKAQLAEMTAKLETATQEKATVESKLQAAEAQLTEATNTIVAHEASLKAYKVNELKSKLVGSVMDEEEFNAKQDTLLGTPAEVIELMTRNVKKETKSTDGRLNMAASEAPKESVTWTLY